MNDKTEEVKEEYYDYLGGTTSQIPLQMLNMYADVGIKTLVPDQKSIEPIDIITRTNLTDKLAHATSMLLLKCEYPFTPGFEMKRRYDAQRYGIDIPDIKLDFLKEKIIKIDLPIRLSVGVVKSSDRIIDFFRGALGQVDTFQRSGSVPEEGRR